ncbi:hypothetical protein V6C03_01680 [Methyloligella sp. 2.7D]|uniref:hypothetical protein n=1 Tax=unclassified Methyloligella TaxID=2625955 RepID=UPI00157C348B|nr:hypothetical protein [Methyloligella sp. GL2]QKP76637.1 hypothetical protein HT051_03740 [Methyloligella sp. GL2]
MSSSVFSPQQIKFEFLSYIKEFGALPEEWRVGCAADAQEAMFGRNGVDRERDIWLWKPALSAKAAAIVYRYLTEQMHVPSAEDECQGSQIFLYRRTPKNAAGNGATG